MSIYSGFATRQLQQTYDECLQTILYLFQKRIMRFYKGQSTNQQKFYTILSKTYTKMKNMETHKYLQPKSSKTIQQLLIYLTQKQRNQDIPKLGNKILEVEELEQSDSYKRMPHFSKKSQSQSKSQRLQSQQNSNKEEQRTDQNRLNTTANKIRKRTPHKNNQVSSLRSTNIVSNIVSARLSRIQNNVKYRQSYSHEKQQNIIEGIQINKILNQPDWKLIKISRNEPRTYFNASHQQLRRNIIKSRDKQQQNVEGTHSTQKDKEDDVKKLIKGYISKTKKTYLKSFYKRKSEIQDMLKCM